MKKILAMLMVLCMVVTLFAGCAGTPDEGKTPADTKPAGNTPVDTKPADNTPADDNQQTADYSDLEPYKLGMITPLTGPGAYGGVEYKNGAELAYQHFGDTINGRRVEVVVADGPSPDASLSEFERLYDEGVRFFSSGYGSLADMGALGLADELEVLYMGMSWSDDIDTSGSDYFFRVGTRASKFGADCINFSIMIGEEYLGKSVNELKVAIVYNTSQMPIADAVKTQADALGVEVVLYEGYASDTQDHVPVITKLMNTEYDIFIPVQQTTDCSAFQKKMYELGYRPPVTLAAGISYDLPDFATLGNEITDGVMTLAFVNPTAPESACPGITRFVEDYTAQYGYAPLTHALMAYCQVQLQYMILEQVSPDEWEDTAKLAEVLRNMDIGVGEMAWYRGVLIDENNENVRAHENMVCQWQNGEMVSILPYDLAVGQAGIPWDKE